MDPASRNRVLMVGGGLIVIALLLVCGPLEGRFGEGQKAVQELPPVAAAPPEPDPEPAVDESALAAAAASAIGAATGGAIGKSDLDVAGAAVEPVAPIVAKPPSPIKVLEASPPKKARPGPPAVSAGPPAIVPPVPVVPSAEELAANAANAFDESFAGVPSDGTVVDRFAPPVDSGPRVSAVASAAQGFNSLALRPCDSPGAGCQNASLPRRAVIPPFNAAPPP